MASHRLRRIYAANVPTRHFTRKAIRQLIRAIFRRNIRRLIGSLFSTNELRETTLLRGKSLGGDTDVLVNGVAVFTHLGMVRAHPRFISFASSQEQQLEEFFFNCN